MIRGIKRGRVREEDNKSDEATDPKITNLQYTQSLLSQTWLLLDQMSHIDWTNNR